MYQSDLHASNKEVDQAGKLGVQEIQLNCSILTDKLDEDSG